MSPHINIQLIFDKLTEITPRRGERTVSSTNAVVKLGKTHGRNSIPVLYLIKKKQTPNGSKI